MGNLYMGETADLSPDKNVKLNKKDIKIVNALFENGRCPYSTIAKKANISRELTAYRIKRLLNNKVLNGFITIINPKALGYLKYDMYVRFQKMHEKKEKEIINKLKQEDSIILVATIGGNYDLALQISVKSIDHFDKILTKVLTIGGDYINTYVIMNVLHEKHIPMNLFGEKIAFSKHHGKSDGSFKKELIKSKKSKTDAFVELDSKDKKILKILATDARASLIDISAEVNLTANAVNYRIKKLIEQNVITGFMATPSFPLLGLEWDSVLLRFKNFTAENEKKFLYFIQQHPYICYSSKLVGNWNYQISIVSKGPLHLRQTLMELRDVFKDTLQEYETMRVFKQHKFAVTGLKDKGVIMS